MNFLHDRYLQYLLMLGFIVLKRLFFTSFTISWEVICCYKTTWFGPVFVQITKI